MAGLVTPVMGRSCNFDMAISAPVLPADTTASVSPAATLAMAIHMDVALPRRTA